METIRARVVPGSRARRVRVGYAAAVTAISTAALVIGAMVNGPFPLFFFFPGIAPLLLAFGLRPGARESELEITPGAVRERGRMGLHLRARDVLGMTTCLHENGYAITVQLRHDPAPHTIIVPDIETLDRVRQALGGGHDGTGVVAWPLQRDQRDVGLLVAAGISSMMCMGVIGMALTAAIPFLRAFPKHAANLPSVALAEAGLTWRWGGLVVYPYAAIAQCTYQPASKGLLLISTSGQQALIPIPQLGMDQALVLASQVNAAARRARGERVLRDSALERVRALRRNEAEPIKSWLGRLEGLAASLNGDNYRSAPISADDLWHIAQDPDESFEDRAGAGRVLIKAMGPGARVRVEEALANTRAPEKRVRVVLEDDIDAAADAIAEDMLEKRNARPL